MASARAGTRRDTGSSISIRTGSQCNSFRETRSAGRTPKNGGSGAKIKRARSPGYTARERGPVVQATCCDCGHPWSMHVAAGQATSRISGCVGAGGADDIFCRCHHEAPLGVGGVVPLPAEIERYHAELAANAERARRRAERFARRPARRNAALAGWATRRARAAKNSFDEIVHSPAALDAWIGHEVERLKKKGRR